MDVGQPKSVQEPIPTLLGFQQIRQSWEKFNIGTDLDTLKPLKNQGFFLVVPIISLSPHFWVKSFDSSEAGIGFEIIHTAYLHVKTNSWAKRIIDRREASGGYQGLSCRVATCAIVASKVILILCFKRIPFQTMSFFWKTKLAAFAYIIGKHLILAFC